MSGDGLACSLCGGALSTGADADQLHCSFCGADFLAERLGQVDARAPAARVTRGEAVAALKSRLQDDGVSAFAVEASRLVHVPFWQIEAKIVGWQRYRLREELPPPQEGELMLPRTAPEREIEETASRDVLVSYPACDVRAFGMIGVAHQLNGLNLKRFSPEAIGADEEVCAVVHPTSAALRRARLSHSQHLLPPRARSIRQRSTLLRTRVQLIYYPIWRLEYGAHVATIDAVRGRFLTGTGERNGDNPSARWLAVAAASGFLSGFHPAFGLYTLATWAAWRLRSTSRRDTWAGWLSSELGRTRRSLVRLGE